MNANFKEKDEITPDLKVAEQFLELLDKQNEAFTFEVIEEPKPKERKVKIKRFHGTLNEHKNALIQANNNGSGVFLAVNQTNGLGRRKIDIMRARAVFVDLDGSPIDPIFEAPLEPHILVESSPGRYHAYWLIEHLPLEEFEKTQRFLAQKFGGDPSVCDLPRLMRLPGFIHRKGMPYQSRIVGTMNTRAYSLQQFREAFNWTYEENFDDQDSSNIHESIVLAELRVRGLLKREEDSETGRWCIRCPWAYEHSDGGEDAYFFAKPSLNHPHGGFNCFHAHCKHRDLRALRFWLGLTPLEGVEPLPLFREVPPPISYPIKALGSVLGGAAEELYRTIQAPLPVIAQSLLGAASLVTQGHANVSTLDGRSVALSLFLISIAESGERKSAIDDVALLEVFKKQSMLCIDYKREKVKYEQGVEIWTEAKKKARLSVESSFTSEFRPEPEQPIMPLIVIEEPTYEGLVKYLEHGQPSVGLFSDEGGRFLGGNAMNRENMLKTLAGLSSLWDAKKDKPITRIRSGDKSLALYGRRCALHLMIQESIYGKLSECSICDTQGFLPRCLVSFPDSMAGNRLYNECNPLELPGVRAFRKQCNSLLNRPYNTAPFPSPANQLELPTVSLSSQAHLKYVEFHNACEKKLGKGGEYYSIRRFGSKAPEHLIRIAGVLALFEDPSVTEISVKYVERAKAIVDYYLSERLRLDSYCCVDQTLFTAQKVLDWAKNRGKEGVKLQDLYQNGPPEVRSKDKAMAILKKLEEHGRAFPVNPRELGEAGSGKAWRFVYS